jgi:hypothetical protein
MEEQTDLFGIPIPSTDKVFIGLVVVHIIISLVALTAGALAMFAHKTSLGHKKNGNIYFWSMSFAFITIVILSIMRWPHNISLLAIGISAFSATVLGRKFAKTKRKGWTRLHLIFMGASYIFLLTGFYVDNGKNLPFWRSFSHWFMYVFPSMIGIPIIVKVMLNHPLIKKTDEN